MYMSLALSARRILRCRTVCFSGKSTLFKMIMGQEQPDSGDVRVGETVVPMYVEQSRSSLDGNRCHPILLRS